MQINLYTRRLLILLLLSTCLLVTNAKGGRGGGSRGGSRGGSSRGSSRSRPTYRPAPAPRPSPRPSNYKPSPQPAPKPAPKPTPRPQPAPSPKPSAPDEAVVAKQPASNPNFKESSPVQQGSADKQPAYNPNHRPDGSAPGGPPPPYAPAGHPAPNAAGGAPPPYSPNQPGQRPYPQQPGGQPQPYPGQQPPPYSGGPPGRPPAYPGQSPPYPVQPGQGGQPYPQQPGFPQQPGANRPYPGGYPQQPGYPGGYPQQPGYPGGYPQQAGMNRPYPVQPGFNYGGGNRPHPQQPLGSNVWQPQSGRPAPAYMNYGGIPTGANMYSKPTKQKGFMGSLMSMGHNKPGKKNKYFGSPYGGMAGGGVSRMGGGFLGRYGKTAALAAILPIVAIGVAAAVFRPRFGYMSMYSPMHYHQYHHHGRGLYPEYAHLYDVYDNDYIGKCQKPLKSEHTEFRCKATFDDFKCDAKCEDGYEFPHNITLISNKCWHYTGVWRPKKNFPECKPICEDDCLNGGECIRPGKCQCPDEFRGDRCQFPKLNYFGCDARKLAKGEKNVGWVCNHSKNETVCQIRCKPPAEFESTAAEEYRCSNEGEWTPNSLPHCVVKEKTD